MIIIKSYVSILIMKTYPPDKYTVYTNIEPDIYKKKFRLYHQALAYAISLTTKPKIKKLLAVDKHHYRIYLDDPDNPDGGYANLVFGFSTDKDINKLVGGEWYFAGGC